MSFRPSDDELLEALDRLVETESIVEAGERLGVNYRTAAKCHEFRQVSQWMREALRKYVRQQGELDKQAEQGEQVGQEAPGGEQVASVSEDEPEGGEEAPLQEPGQGLRREVEALRAELASLRERVEAVEGQAAQGRGGGGAHVDVGDVGGVDAGDRGRQRRSVAPPRRVFPELITEEAEPGEEQVYGAAAELVIEWREAWAARKAARHTLARLRAEWRRLELELRLIGVFGLTPPPADAPWRERRREQELAWRGRALRRLRWQLPLTWCLHGLLRLLTLGVWGRSEPPEPHANRSGGGASGKNT